MGLKKADFSRLGRVADAMHDELLPFMADVIRTDTDPYVPARTMSLATSAFVNEADLQEGRIVYGNTARPASRSTTTRRHSTTACRASGATCTRRRRAAGTRRRPPPTARPGRLSPSARPTR